jgi:hypothetical protein
MCMEFGGKAYRNRRLKTGGKGETIIADKEM